MWVMTTIGFFSIVEKPGDRADGMLTIRARQRGDLEALQREMLPALGNISDAGGSDYPFRARAARADVAEALRRMVDMLDYPNFKSAVAARQGRARAQHYGRVWSILCDLQREGG
jgi:hypothetical protein